MSGGSRIRVIGPEDAQNAQGEALAAMDAEGGAGDALELDHVYDGEGAPDGWEVVGEARPARSLRRLLIPAIALLAIAGWTAFFGWSNREAMLAGATAEQWTAWFASWAMPVLLVLTAWLVATRNSSREADRFGLVAMSLAEESSRLEGRLITVNRELSLAREFLASQSRELEALGRIASERLSRDAEQLQMLIQSNGQQVDAIASVSTTALENMGRLRDDLPVLANSAKDVSNQIGTAGRTAQVQVSELVAGFERLNEFGRASDAQVSAIRSKIAEALTAFETQTGDMERLTEARFATLRESSEAFRAELDAREVDALAAIRRRADALGEELAGTAETLDVREEEALRSLRLRLGALREEAGTVSGALVEGETNALTSWETRIATLRERLLEAIAEIERIDAAALESANRKLEALRQEAELVDANIAQRDAQLIGQIQTRRKMLAEDESAAILAFNSRLEALDEAIASRRNAQLDAADVLSQRSEAVTAQIDAIRRRVQEIAETAEVSHAAAARSAESVADNLALTRATAGETNQAIAELTDASVRLLELIQASGQHGAEKLPAAIGVAETRLAAVRKEAEALGGLIGEADGRAQELSNYVLSAQASSRETIAEVEHLRAGIVAAHAQTHESLVEMRRDVAAVDDASTLLSERAQGELRQAITTLEEAARQVPANLEQHAAGSIGVIAARFGAEAGAVLDRAIDSSAGAVLARFEETTAKAGDAGRETARLLRDQLAKVDELAANLENRVARAREQAEEQVGNDFARRTALITESLHSSAIDIGKVLSSDVTDTAWASYLRGDRGIFTRRAVRLLDNTEAREIAEIYDRDDHFREVVSRYIHDFEGMLRSVLSTRDGKALGVTLLSSDMGKLYVALAQAIERLRD